ncbi:MAG: polysaccharide deacetylase family protein [Acetobacteraceae bacterium]
MTAERFTLPGDRRIALSVVVNVEEGAEQNISAGDRKPEPVDELAVALRAPVRNLANESNYQYGINAGAPRILRVLDKFSVSCTFTAAAVALERAPGLAARIRDSNHEICSHGHRWVHQFSFDEAQERSFIRAAADSLERSTGRRPLGWLSRYLFTERTRRLLAEQGFLYHMDDYADDIPRWDWVPLKDEQRGIVVLPYALDTNDMKFWLAPGYTPQQWLDYAVATFDQLYDEGTEQPKIMSLGLHLRIIGRPGRIGALERFLQHVGSRPDVWTATRLAIAQRFVELNPPG